VEDDQDELLRLPGGGGGGGVTCVPTDESKPERCRTVPDTGQGSGVLPGEALGEHDGEGL
jgi:hypothetical protein